MFGGRAADGSPRVRVRVPGWHGVCDSRLPLCAAALRVLCRLLISREAGKGNARVSVVLSDEFAGCFGCGVEFWVSGSVAWLSAELQIRLAFTGWLLWRRRCELFRGHRFVRSTG